MIKASGIDTLYPRTRSPMEFMLLTMGMLGLIVLVLVLLARAYPGSGADLVDWKPTRSFEDEARLELEDVQQMIEAQNEYRRRRGADDISELDAERWAREDEAVRERARAGGHREGVDEPDPGEAPPDDPRPSDRSEDQTSGA